MKVKALLITGIHRSGSTWMGKTMGLSKELQYIHEPFNIVKNSKSPLKYWYQYFTVNTSQNDQNTLRNYLKNFHRINLKRFFKSCKKAKYLGQVKDAFQYEMKCFKAVPLFKDPIALLSSEWFYKALNAHVIVSIRHPAAFVSSVKVKNWIFDFNNLLQQETLLQDYLMEYKEAMELAVKNNDLIESGILIWNILYSVVFKLQNKYNENPNWFFIRHEDMSRNPNAVLADIFDTLELDFTPEIQNAILQSTKPQKSDYLSRDSKKNIYSWKSRLEVEEIEKIKENTREVWQHFYSDQDW